MIALATSVVAFGSMLGLAGCSDGTPRVVTSHEYPNPSGSLVATVEVLDNGLGFGAGMLYNEIHIAASGERSFVHGNPAPTVVYYCESTSEEDLPPEVKWLKDDQLLVTLAPRGCPARQRTAIPSVFVKYVVREK